MKSEGGNLAEAANGDQYQAVKWGGVPVGMVRVRLSNAPSGACKRSLA